MLFSTKRPIFGPFVYRLGHMVFIHERGSIPRDRQHEILCLPNIIKDQNKYISYVGYTNDLTNRIKMHNTSKGAKFTRGKNGNLYIIKLH